MTAHGAWSYSRGWSISASLVGRQEPHIRAYEAYAAIEERRPEQRNRIEFQPTESAGASGGDGGSQPPAETVS